MQGPPRGRHVYICSWAVTQMTDGKCEISEYDYLVLLGGKEGCHGSSKIILCQFTCFDFCNLKRPQF